MGLIWALMSVALVSAAQLTLRAAMTTLPSAQQPLAFLLHLLHFETGTLALLAPACPENVCEETVPKSILFDGSTATSQEGASMVPVTLKLTVLLPS